MEELQITLTPARVDQRNFGVQLSNWRVGQQLTALVVDTRPNGGLLLSVAGKTFAVTSDLPVQPGTRLALEVKQVGQDVVLRRIPDSGQPRPDASGRSVQTTLALGSMQPSSLMNQLAALPSRFGSPEMQEIVRELRGRVLRPEGLTPAAIKRGLQDSGLFTEADLLGGRLGRARQSGKASLSQLQTVALALADDLDPELAETRALHQLVEKATALLNGIAQQQLASLPPDEGGQRWVFTLPVQLGELFTDLKMQFERAPRELEQEDNWQALLTFDFPKMGLVVVKLQLQGGSVSVSFECEAVVTSTHLNRHLGFLESQLAAQNLRPLGLAATTADRGLHRADSHSSLSVEA